MALRPWTYEAVKSTGDRMVSRLHLPHGQSQICIGAHESGGGTIGSVADHVEVPDFRSKSLSISRLALTSQHAALRPTFAAKAVSGALDEMATNWILSNRRQALVDDADAVVDLLVNGMRRS